MGGLGLADGIEDLSQVRVVQCVVRLELDGAALSSQGLIVSLPVEEGDSEVVVCNAPLTGLAALAWRNSASALAGSLSCK